MQDHFVADEIKLTSLLNPTQRRDSHTRLHKEAFVCLQLKEQYEPGLG